MNKLKSALHIANVPRKLADHLVGKNHTNYHRRWCGAFVMLIGVGFVKLTGMIDIYLIHFAGDIIGYAIHGVGAIPFLTAIENLND